MKKFIVAFAAMLALSTAAHADSTTTVTGAPSTTTTTGTNQMTTHVDDTSNISVQAISNNGGKSSPPPIPGAVVAAQFAGLFGGPGPDIETVALPMDVLFKGFCRGVIPAEVNERLHKSVSEDGESGKTRISFEPCSANFATYADTNIRRAAVNPIDVIHFDDKANMIAYGGDREVYVLGIMSVKSTIAKMDDSQNETIENDAVYYLRHRGLFAEVTPVSVGFWTRSAPSAVYSTGSSWGLSAGGSGMAETVARFFGITAGGAKNTGVTGASARPEQRFYLTVDCTGKTDAQCERMRADKAPSIKLAAFGDRAIAIFNPRAAQQAQASSSELLKRVDEVAANQKALAGQVMKDHEAGQALQGRVEKVEKCADCENAKAKPEVKPAAKPAAKAPVHHVAKPVARPAPVAPCDPVTAAQTAHDVCQAKISAAKPAASAAPKK